MIEARLKYIVTSQKGKVPKIFSDDSSLPPYLSMEYLRDKNDDISYVVDDGNCFLVDENEILILYDGANAGEIMLSRKGFLSSTMAILKPDDKYFQKKYFYYFLKSKEGKFKRAANGTTIPHLDQEMVFATRYHIASLSEQTGITKYLDFQSEKINCFIEKKQRFIELLIEQRATIINELVTKGLSNEIRGLYNLKPIKGFADTNINWVGKIPVEWKFLRAKNIFDLITEPAIIGNNEELLSVYTHIGVKPRKDLEERGNRSQTTDNYWHVKIGDIIVNKLLAWMGAIGISEYDGVTSPAYDVLRLKIEGNPYYYHHLFRSTKICDEFKKYSKGIMDVRLRLYFTEFGKIPLPVPSLEEQNAIVEHIKTETQTIDTAISKAEREIELIKEYKEAMIAEAVMGKMKN